MFSEGAMKDAGKTTFHASKAEAMAALDDAPLSCVTWDEKGKRMSAIYWNGKRRIQPADKKISWWKVT